MPVSASRQASWSCGITDCRQWKRMEYFQQHVTKNNTAQGPCHAGALPSNANTHMVEAEANVAGLPALVHLLRAKTKPPNSAQSSFCSPKLVSPLWCSGLQQYQYALHLLRLVLTSRNGLHKASTATESAQHGLTCAPHVWQQAQRCFAVICTPGSRSNRWSSCARVDMP